MRPAVALCALLVLVFPFASAGPLGALPGAQHEEACWDTTQDDSWDETDPETGTRERGSVRSTSEGCTRSDSFQEEVTAGDVFVARVHASDGETNDSTDAWSETSRIDGDESASSYAGTNDSETSSWSAAQVDTAVGTFGAARACREGATEHVVGNASADPASRSEQGTRARWSGETCTDSVAVSTILGPVVVSRTSECAGRTDEATSSRDVHEGGAWRSTYRHGSTFSDVCGERAEADANVARATVRDDQACEAFSSYGSPGTNAYDSHCEDGARARFDALGQRVGVSAGSACASRGEWSEDHDRSSEGCVDGPRVETKDATVGFGSYYRTEQSCEGSECTGGGSSGEGILVFTGGETVVVPLPAV